MPLGTSYDLFRGSGRIVQKRAAPYGSWLGGRCVELLRDEGFELSKSLARGAATSASAGCGFAVVREVWLARCARQTGSPDLRSGVAPLYGGRSVLK